MNYLLVIVAVFAVYLMLKKEINTTLLFILQFLMRIKIGKPYTLQLFITSIIPWGMVLMPLGTIARWVGIFVQIIGLTYYIVAIRKNRR